MEMGMEASAGRKTDPPADMVSGFPARCLRFGSFQLDLQRQELRKEGAIVKVQGKVYQALVTLLENPGEIVTREVMRARMWPRDTGLNYDANVNTTVNKLRGLLGDTGEQAKFIETIPRRGYSFIAKVEYTAEPEAAQVAGGKPAKEAESVSPPRALLARIFSADHAGVWFTAGVVALMIAAMLFGAAITLYSHRAF